MTGKRKRYSADLRAKVALEALRGERTALCVASVAGCNLGDFFSLNLHMGHVSGLIPICSGAK